jgi:hypothetical protein
VDLDNEAEQLHKDWAKELSHGAHCWENAARIFGGKVMEKTFVAQLAQDSRVFQPISGLNDSNKQCKM